MADRRRSTFAVLGLVFLLVVWAMAFTGCDTLLGEDPSDKNGKADNGDVDNGEPDNGTTDPLPSLPGAEIPPLSAIETTVGLSVMLFDEILGNDSLEGVEVDGEIDENDGGEATITFTDFEPEYPHPDYPDLVMNGVVVLSLTPGAGYFTLVLNGEVAVTDYLYEEVCFNDATWVIPESDDDPFSMEWSGTVVLDDGNERIEYQKSDMLQSVRAAWAMSGFVFETIMPVALDFWYYEDDGDGVPGLEVRWEDEEDGPVEIEFDGFDPAGQGFFLDGLVVVVMGIEDAPYTIGANGAITVGGDLPIEEIKLSDIEFEWSDWDEWWGQPAGELNSVSGVFELDGVPYPAEYLMGVLFMFR